MSKSIIILIAVLALAIGVGTSWLIQNRTTYVIHYVNYRENLPLESVFRESLEKRGMKVKIIFHNANRDPTRLPAIRDVIHADKSTDLVITWGTTVALNIFGKHTDSAPYIREYPGIFTAVSDPIKSAIIHETNIKSRTITGTLLFPDIGRQFTTMMIYRPVSKIGIMYTPNESNSVNTVNAFTEFATRFKVEIVAIPFEMVDGKATTNNVAAALDAMKAAGVGWLYMLPDTFLTLKPVITTVVSEAHRRDIPTFASSPTYMENGVCVGLVSSEKDLGNLIAEQAEKILVKNIKPSEIDVSSVRFQHQMNMKVAAALGIKPPTKGLDADIVSVGDK